MAQKVILSFIGVDRWERAVYNDDKGIIWKDIDCSPPMKVRNSGSLHSCNNEYEGEPCWPMKSDKQIIFV